MKKEDHEALMDEPSIIFTNPENIMEETSFSMIKQMRKRIAFLVLDEAHCMVTWGKTFRSAYKRLRELRAILSKTPVLCLTATTTDDITADIKETLGIIHFNEIFIVPDRPNVHLSIKKGQSDINEDMSWYINKLCKEGNKAPKAVIFCRSIDTVTAVYADITMALEDMDGDDSVLNIYHAHLDEKSQTSIPKEFSKPNSFIRCLITTVAFGMGVQVSDIMYVIHWGPPASALDYFQETGRCARNQLEISQGHAILYCPRNSVRSDRVSQQMIEIIGSSNEKCIRQSMLNALNIAAFSSEDISKCCGGQSCCSYCDTNCVNINIV